MITVDKGAIERFMQGQVACWNRHDKEAFMALYREMASESLDIEYVGRPAQDGWFVIEDTDKPSKEFEEIPASDDLAKELVGISGLWEKNLVPYSRVTALERDRLPVEAESGLLFLWTVAAVTVFDEDRLNVFDEVHLAIRGGRQSGNVQFGGLGWRRQKA